jgi:hypothetical protein
MSKHSYTVEVEFSLGNRSTVLATAPDLSLEEAQRVAKILTYNNLTCLIRNVAWKEPVDAEYL